MLDEIFVTHISTAALDTFQIMDHERDVLLRHRIFVPDMPYEPVLSCFTELPCCRVIARDEILLRELIGVYES